MAKCKACGADIVWVITIAGKNMPCDEGIVPYWNDKNGKDVIVTQEGETVHCSTEPHPGVRADGSGRVPHWYSCPFADKFKKKKGKKS